MNSQLNETCILSLSQFGLRTFSTQDSFFTETVRSEIDNNEFLSTALPDLSKAFDSIKNEMLYHKLHSLGFEDSTLQLIQTISQQRLHKFLVTNTESYWIELYQGFT